MSRIQQYKCPCCDGAIEFSSREQKMVCPYCDTEFEVDTLREYDQVLNQSQSDNMEWDTGSGEQWREGETEGLRVYTCNACGGEIVGDETLAASSCPFCDNPVVMMGQFTGDLKPDYVIPFKFDKNAAVAALNNHYKGKKLLPKVFKDQNHIKEVKGLYVPVWLFDADVDANVRYKASSVRHWSDSSFYYTETTYYMVTRAGDIGFANVPVDGSSNMDDALMESIEPFSMRDAVDFQTAYLSGYLAEECDYYLDCYVNGVPFDFIKAVAFAAIGGIIVGLIVALVLKGQLKSIRRQTRANDYVKSGSMHVTHSRDIYLYRKVTSRPKETNKSSGSGSGSGSGRSVGGGSF